MSVDALGNPLRFILTGGQQHDITQADALIADYAGEYVIADKGYDAQEFRQHILERGLRPVIPPRSNRKEPQAYDAYLYRERHLVECFINKIKHYRRVFSRFEKLDTRYLGFLQFTAALILPLPSFGYGEMSTQPSHAAANTPIGNAGPTGRSCPEAPSAGAGLPVKVAGISRGRRRVPGRGEGLGNGRAIDQGCGDAARLGTL